MRGPFSLYGCRFTSGSRFTTLMFIPLDPSTKPGRLASGPSQPPQPPCPLALPPTVANQGEFLLNAGNSYTRIYPSEAKECRPGADPVLGYLF
eukprot:3804861-Rhodomonas_salina.3